MVPVRCQRNADNVRPGATNTETPHSSTRVIETGSTSRCADAMHQPIATLRMTMPQLLARSLRPLSARAHRPAAVTPTARAYQRSAYRPKFSFRACKSVQGGERAGVLCVCGGGGKPAVAACAWGWAALVEDMLPIPFPTLKPCMVLASQKSYNQIVLHSAST
eukprot:365542-Chlamydomonas_euryale.AAC.18